jgi:hypothetical protein
MGGRIRYRTEDVHAFVKAHLRGHASEAISISDTAQVRGRRARR